MEVSFAYRFSVQYTSNGVCCSVKQENKQTYCVNSVVSEVKSALGRCKKFFVLAPTILYIN